MQSSPRIEELRQKFHENPRRYFAPLANEYRKAGDPEQAIAICRAHLAQQPAHMSGHVVYGQALYDAHRIDEAREVFQLALALDPENIIVLRHLGDIARQRGDVAEARSWYSRALDGDPHDAEVAAYLAELTEPLVSHGVESEATAPVAHAAEAVSEASTALDLDESPYLETEEATAATSLEAPAEDAPQPAERQSRLTPTGEGFPILTRTLAELYLQQGHIEAALDIYRQLAEHEPEDADIRARIAALTLDTRVGGHDLEIAEITDGVDEPVETTPDDELAVTTPDDELAVTTPDDELADTTVDEALAATTPEEKLAEATAGEELAALAPESELTLTDISWPEFGTDDLAGDAVEPLERAAGEPETSDRLWDTADFLGGGFFEDTEAEDEIFGLADDAFSVASQGAKPAPAPGPEPPVSVPESEPDDVTTAAQSAEMAAEGDPSELVRDAEPESEIEAASPPVEFMSANLAGAAYFENPELPDDGSPYAPSEAEAEIAAQPEAAVDADVADVEVELEADAEPVEAATPALTVREFFATLGSIRPPFANEADDAYTGADAEPAYPALSTDEAVVTDDAYPVADDAFASLFAGSPINAEDSRAAAALSSAVAHGAPFSTPSTPSGSRRPSPSPPREMAAQPGQESEEDVRRFREWLDGLAES